MTPGDSDAGTVSVSVTGVVAVVVSSSEELMKEVVLEAEGLVVTGVCANCSPSVPSPSPSGSLLTPGLAFAPLGSSSSPFTTSL